MNFIAEFVGSFIFVFIGYAYMCNITLKKTLIGKLSYIELVFAWSLAVGFGLTIAVVMGGPAYLNPGVVFGSLLFCGLSIQNGLLYLLMEFLAAGAAVLVCYIFFYDSFRESQDVSTRGIFAAYPVQKNIWLNMIQEIIATFLFLLLVLGSIKAASGESAALQIGVIGFAAVALVALSVNTTGFSMNAMRSVFSSIWYAVLPLPGMKKDKVDWGYQLLVNGVASSIGGILAVFAVSLF